ncbi:uncharacterized protein LOC116260614 [Nymphaea colorata]|uniref:uncharacterized protein LOC116260614 n=1 Tax=Nymphaea colorata TaxID=210225 RepID=UPI00129D30BD|nr:uncharacterized protein LOC116260614 [Nymphaea colorata]
MAGSEGLFYYHPEIEEEGIMEDQEEEVEFRSAFCCLSWSASRSRRCSVVERSLLHHGENGLPVTKFRPLKDEKQRMLGAAARRRWRSFVRQLDACRVWEACKLGKGAQFRYDPRSHALNFEDDSERDLDDTFAGFADRFAPPASMRGNTMVAIN